VAGLQVGAPTKEEAYLRLFGRRETSVREVAGVLASFGAALCSRGLSDKSVASYLARVRRFAAWYEGACGTFDPAAVNQLDVAECRRWLHRAGPGGCQRCGSRTYTLSECPIIFIMLNRGSQRWNAARCVFPPGNRPLRALCG
jgi:hypothetical protein